MDLNRLKHSYAVACKMKEIGISLNLCKEEIDSLFLLGFNHDIGYEFSIDGKEHGKIGGLILKESGYKYWKEVYYHGIITDEYGSMYLDILNQADMQIDKYGNDVGYDVRLEDIKSRYGESSNVYNSCYNLIKSLKEKEEGISLKKN